MKHDRTLVTLSAIAILFILLGAGNVIFGRSKHAHYANLLSTATSELATSELQSKAGLSQTALNVDQQTVFVNRLKARVSFYSFVVLGGQCFLAVAGVCLLAILVRIKFNELSDIQTGE